MGPLEHTPVATPGGPRSDDPALRSLEIEERRLAIEERRLALEEKRLALMQQQQPQFYGAAAPVPPAKPEAMFRDLWKLYWPAEGKFKGDHRTREWRGKTLLKYFGDCTAKEITSGRVNKYRDERAKQETKYDAPPAVATINREVALLRRVLSWAEHPDQELIDRSRLKKVHMPDEDNIRRAKLLDPELEKLRQRIELDKPAGLVLWAVILVLADSGMREKEAFGLKWTTFDPKTGRTQLVRTDTKGKRLARVPRLSQRTLDAIAQLPRISEYVFVNPKPGKWYRKRYGIRYLYRLYQEALARAGLQGPEGETITFHSLRHTFHYRARVIWKWPERVIMMVMGHKTRAASERYGVVDAEEVNAAFDERDRIMAEDAGLAAGTRRGPHRSEERPGEPDVAAG